MTGGPDPLREGERSGRFVTLRDVDGLLHAVSASAVAAVCETDGGSLVLLPGGRLIRVEQDLRIVLDWLDGGHR